VNVRRRAKGVALRGGSFSTGTMSQPQSFVVIIAGGRGERFWPQSRIARPKHLLPIVGRKPLLAQTLERIRTVVPPANTFVITSGAQEKAVRAVCQTLPRKNIVVEPVGRDTAPAVALGAALVGHRDPNGIFAVLPADHVIDNVAAYRRDLKAAFAAARAAGVMVTIGLKPSEPATGYGYIRVGTKWQTFDRRSFFYARRFVEKPNLATAQRYLDSGEYLWNAGMFVWSVPVVESALRKFAPSLLDGLEPVRAALAKRRALGPVLKRVYPELKKISVDYAILENSDNVVVTPASFDWDDVGAWPAVARHRKRDAHGNVLEGRALVEQGENNIVLAEGSHLVAVVGADDLIVVQTPDATLVCPKDRAQDIKALLTRVAALRDGKKYL